MAFASAALTHMQHESTGGRNPNLRSAVNSGMVGVTTNPNNNSYHHSKNSAPFKNVGAYTNRWANDLVSNHPSINRDAVTGSDRSMSRADMIKATRLYKAVFDDPTDPRRKYFAEVIGTLDGVTAIRMDFATGMITRASVDHTWHLHEGWWYLYWGSWQAADADMSIQRGETKQQYINRHNPPAPPPAPVPQQRRRKMVEYVWLMRPGNTEANLPVWAVERPYHPDPKRRWERIEGVDNARSGRFVGGFESAGAGVAGVHEKDFLAREAMYAPGGAWAGLFPVAAPPTA